MAKTSQKVAYSHKIIPDAIRPQVETALTYYPELREVPIRFKFKKNIKKSTMQAQPLLSSFFGKKENRKYVVLISERFHIEGESFRVVDVQDDVMVGWIGHELGHIVDYKNRSAFGMLIFGFKYLFSTMHIKEVERAADTFAVKHGMYQYILATKNFILNNTSISPKYKARIKRLYMSPEEIMELVNKMKRQDLEKKVEGEMKEEEERLIV